MGMLGARVSSAAPDHRLDPNGIRAFYDSPSLIVRPLHP